MQENESEALNDDLPPEYDLKALLKTAATGWRMVRYYAGNEPYQKAGPPPTLMRLLGPLVVLSTLGLLASGVVLVLIGLPFTRAMSAVRWSINSPSCWRICSLWTAGEGELSS